MYKLELDIEKQKSVNISLLFFPAFVNDIDLSNLKRQCQKDYTACMAKNATGKWQIQSDKRNQKHEKWLGKRP